MRDEISYTLRLVRPEWNVIEVEATFPTSGRPVVELMMAVWTPGSYLVREFARHVEAIQAAAPEGQALPIEKVAKNRWRVQAPAGATRIEVRYRLHAHELSVRTNFVDAGFALINGAATFLTLAGDHHRPHRVTLVAPPSWKVVMSTLEALGGAAAGQDGGEVVFLAEDFDRLVDSPIYAGNAALHRFEVAGRTHWLVNEGEVPGEGGPAGGGRWDGARAADAAEKVVRQQIAFWGEAPYPRYVFLNLIVESRGGLEHADGSVLMASRWRTGSREGWLDWVGLVSHELFHAWNVKRLRPAELDAFDYEREMHTRSLWEVEGVTSYYDDLLVRRAGLCTRDEYLRRLGKQIEEVETAPGSRVQSLADSSYDSWIKFYRRDENFINAGISYYTKGAVVSFLLDAAIRRATDGERSLDDVMRLAYHRFSGARGFLPAELAALVAEIATTEVEAWLRGVIAGTGELDYGPALDWYGLRFCEFEAPGKRSAAAGTAAPGAWLGVEVETVNGRLLVTTVRRGTPAHEAGLNTGDEILAIGDHRVPPEGLRERLGHHRPGAAETLLVARRERLLRLPVVLGAVPRARFRLDPEPAATAEQRRRLAVWLGAEGAPTDEPVQG